MLLLLACAAATGAVSGPSAAQAPSLRDQPDLAWLRYGQIASRGPLPATLPEQIVVLGTDPVMTTAGEELAAGLERLSGRRPGVVTQSAPGRRITLAALPALAAASPAVVPPRPLRPDDFWITDHGEGSLLVTGGTPRGVLYGAFALLRQLAVDPAAGSTAEPQGPAAEIRWVNHWDNLDGTIERGYAGGSIFFANGAVVDDLSRVRAYAPAAGVDRHQRVHHQQRERRHARADAGVPAAAGACRGRVPSLWDSPVGLGRLQQPRAGWGASTPSIRSMRAWRRGGGPGPTRSTRAVPDLGGFVLKADSEGRLGPSAYGRTHADAANVIARALAPHGGMLLYRGFVYDHHMDWRNPRNDRARAAYDNFSALDGQFDANVVLQVKHGPIDFQVREPASPLFAALRRTNQAIELQITQEYTGQQRHVVFLAPMWKEVLDFDMHAGRPRHAGRPARHRAHVRPAPRWLRRRVERRARTQLARARSRAGQPLRLRPPGLGSGPARRSHRRRVVAAHVRHDPAVAPVIRGILMDSWPAYEGYTGPLGAGTLTDIINIHYGPGVESSERNGWGQWHRADEKGVGMDRTVATGTGYIGQYPAPVAAMYESLETCPDALLLFMHHVPYTHVLHSGKTVIQHIYDSHYAGAAGAAAVRRALARARGPRGRDAIPGRARPPRIPGRARRRLAGCRVRVVPADVGHTRCGRAGRACARAPRGRDRAAHRLCAQSP